MYTVSCQSQIPCMCSHLADSDVTMLTNLFPKKQNKTKKKLQLFIPVIFFNISYILPSKNMLRYVSLG